MSTTNAFNYSMAIQSVNIVATGTAIFLTGYIGRRKFYLFGTAAIAIFQMILGVLGVAGGTEIAIGVAIMMIMIQLAFKLSVGPICYGIIGEIPNSRLRNKTIALARIAYIVTNIGTGQLIPRMLGTTVSLSVLRGIAPTDSQAFNWGAKSGWFWFGIGFFCFTYTFFRVPETKDRQYLELDQLFADGVSARKFSSTKLDSEWPACS
jgi:SP family general alpha glucoside:H+ symporter-like MFS transporter